MRVAELGEGGRPEHTSFLKHPRAIYHLTLLAMLCGCRETLGRAGKAFDGLEALLGGGRNGTFDLQVSSGSHDVRIVRVIGLVDVDCLYP